LQQQQDTCTRIKVDTTKADESLKEINDYHGFVYFVLLQLMQKLSAFMKSVMHQDTSLIKNCKGKKKERKHTKHISPLQWGSITSTSSCFFFFLLQSARQEPEK
jgi:hypothetical protein